MRMKVIDYSTLLNSEQLAAVSTEAQHVRVIAGAGSGKTRVLTYRIAYLIDHFNVDPSRILALTFTVKAAREMENRVVSLIPEAAKFLSVSTFHSFCARFLRMEAGVIGYPKGFTIFDETDQEKLVKDVAASHGLKRSEPLVKTCLEYIRSKKGKGLYPEDISIGREAFENEKQCLAFYLEYEQRKADMCAFDFDDLILVTIRILEDYPQVQNRWRGRYQHILIDEFQDTNDIEYRLITLLINPATSLYVVGDPDQTIYTWRGANQGIILRFPDTFPGTQDVILARNYRSTKNILNAANSLIAHNKKRVKKDLYTEDAAGDPITAKRFDESSSEAHFVGAEIESLVRRGIASYKDIAVLYRSSYVTRSFESEFAARQIPYRIFGGLRFYQRKEVKDLLAFFRLLLNPLDNVSFDRIANVPRRSVGESSLEKIRDLARSYHVSQYNMFLHSDLYDLSSLPTRVISALLVLISKMEACKVKLNEGLETYSAVLRAFITDLGYYDYITEDEALDEDRAGNVNALFEDIDHYISNNPESTFDEYLQNVTLLTSQDDMNGGDYVSLMTVHVAKGLEFPIVFVICLNDGTFPSYRAVQDPDRDGLEEERRLCYVAMTRAKKRLYLTTNKAYSYTTDSHQSPSRFFKEAGIILPDPDGPRFGGYGSGKKKVTYGDTTSFFSDGEAISPFEEKPAPKPVPKSNGITDWAVGDRVHHERFGDGTVVEKIDASIIIVAFDEAGKKTLLSNHPMLSRILKKGANA